MAEEKEDGGGPEAQYAEVMGLITKVENTKPKEPARFKIYLKNSQKSYNVICDFFAPARENDTIYALCTIEPNGVLKVVKPPFIQPAVDKDDVIKCLIRGMKKGFVPAVRLYSKIESLSTNGNVVNYLCLAAQLWNDTRKMDIILAIDTDEIESVRKLLEWWHRERNVRRLHLLGLTNREINACRMTCETIYNKCMENPYVLPAIPLEKCAEILDRINKKPEHIDRIRGSMVRVIWDNQNKKGWSCVPLYIMKRQFPDILEHKAILEKEYGVVFDMESVYLEFTHRVETFIAQYLTDMVSKDKIKYDTPVDDVVRLSAKYSQQMSEDQVLAIQGALDHTICVITGAAGSGKTTILKEIIANWELRGRTYGLCSFTGKAVARIREVTKKKTPATIHRMIMNSKKEDLTRKKKAFEKDIEFEQFDAIIIDETSMVTTELLWDLLQAYPKVKQLVFVGDSNQLSPISWGTLFQQMLVSERIPVYRLVNNHRVYTVDGEIDGVIANANNIIHHDPEYPFEFTAAANFSIIEGGIQRVYDIIKGCYAGGIKMKDLVVLCPYNKYLESLNKEFQEIYNDSGRSHIDSRGSKWKIGDRVIMTENDNDIGVYNGESGVIKDLTDKEAIIDFGSSGIHKFLMEPTLEPGDQEGVKKYRYGDMAAEEVLEGKGDDDERTMIKVRHGYALTIDKSQGSEWDFVICYFPEMSGGSFINKNRIYTAITRTKRACWVVTHDVDALNVAAVKKSAYRSECLSRRLKEKLPEMKPLIIKSDDSYTEEKEEEYFFD